MLVAATAAALGGACRSACFDPDQPLCVDRFDGTWLVAHRMGATLEDRDVRTGDGDPVLTLRGDAALGATWSIDRVEDSLVLGFPDAGAVGVLAQPRGVGECSAALPRLLAYVPDDTLDREPQLQVRVSSCSDISDVQEVLFAGPSDFGRQVLAWPNESGWDLWTSAPAESISRGSVFRFSDAGDRPSDQRGFDAAQLLEGTASGDRLGTTLRTCGDLDGDGLDELAITMPGFSGDAVHDARELAGAVVVVTPGALPTDRDWDLADADAVLWGQAKDQAGTDVRCDEDLTGDGLVDLVVGAPFAGEGDAGAVYLVAGGTLADGALADVARATWVAGESGEELGASLAIGDVDGDGIADVIAGAPGSDAGGAASGAVRILSGALWTQEPVPAGVLYVGRAADAVDGIVASARTGSLVAVADLDRDGTLEVLASAWRADRDGLRLHAGEIVGWSGELVTDLVGANASEAAFVVRGEESHQEVGRVLVVRDIDNDGAIDIVTTARRRAQ